MTNDLSTLICLFHHQDYAQAALEEILAAGIPEANVLLIGGPGSQITANKATLTELNVPAKDVQHLLDGIADGGAVVAVSAISAHAEKVEAIFADHKAGKIDEATVADDLSGQAVPFAGALDDAPPAPLAAAEIYDPIMPAELAAEGEDLVLVTGTVDAAGNAHIESIQPVEVLPDERQDVDPRELGLDTRMNPGTGYGQVQ
jgi:hypothetical protein